MDWLCLWEDLTIGQSVSFSRETFQCAKQSSAVLASLYEQLIEVENFTYFLPGKCQSDKLEGKFGKYRQMIGGNMYASVRQFLEANRSEKIRNLAELNIAINQIKDIFSEPSETVKEVAQKSATDILCCIVTDNSIELVPNVPSSELNILYYVAGCFSRSLCRQTKCQNCKALLVSTENISICVNNEADFLNSVNRGGLTKPTELVFILCIQAWHFFQSIMAQPALKHFLVSENVHSRLVFQTAFEMYLNEFEETRLVFLVQTCQTRHSFKPFAWKLSKKLFNIFSKNLVADFNSAIAYSTPNRNTNTKRLSNVHKVTKLQSNKV